MEDKRFACIAKDPKFRRVPKTRNKTNIDKRFQSMFTDKKFESKYKTDERGRPVKHHSTRDLKKYYDQSSEDSESESELSDDENDHQAEVGKHVRAPKSHTDEEDNDQLDKKLKTDKKISELVQRKLKNLGVDYARGESQLLSDSSSDDEESDEELSEGEEIEHKWGELDADADTTDNVTYRLAACNMDWDRIKAVDLMVLFNSFLPQGGVIKSVEIYPSEFGKKRMQEEETKGPIELVESKNEDAIDGENEEGSKYHMEKLRQYQLNRLKYYYAVISFDSPESANKIYNECDGMEYESSATKIDLRFIPDDMTFDEKPTEICEKLPEVNKYKPRFFTTTALQQAKVELTWDETDPDRLEVAEKLNSGKIDDISEADLQNYLAGSSDEEQEENSNDSNEEDQGTDVIGKYKALLQDIEEKEKNKKESDVQMEISWGVDLKEKTDKKMREKIAKIEDKTPFEQYLEKRKQKIKQKKEQRKKQQTSESEDDIPSDIDMNDPYFAEEFNNPEFKKKNKKERIEENIDADEEKSKQAELELLLMNEDGKKHFSLNKIQEGENESKSKRKKKKKETKEKKEDDFEINVNDNRFSALFSSHHFNLDPTDPHFKKTKNMEVLIQEKLKRRNKDGEEETKNKKLKVGSNTNTELNMLVKSVKRKAQAFKK